jgi:uncharacterized protein (TIGR02145 family)
MVYNTDVNCLQWYVGSNVWRNGYGTSYPAFECGVQFTDSRIDINYTNMRIGDQCRMDENLSYLPVINLPWDGGIAEPYCNKYVYTGANVAEAKALQTCHTYGVLYNGPAANISCPTGRHLPTDVEWRILER